MSEPQKSLAAMSAFTPKQLLAPADRRFVIDALELVSRAMFDEILKTRQDLAKKLLNFEEDDGIPRKPVAILSSAYAQSVGLAMDDGAAYLLFSSTWEENTPFAKRCKSRDELLATLGDLSPFRLNLLFTETDRAHLDWVRK